MSNPQEAFVDLLLAAMTDAALNGKLTQLQTTITPEGTNTAQIVRLIVIPEKMDFVWPKHQPLGTYAHKN